LTTGLAAIKGIDAQLVKQRYKQQRKKEILFEKAGGEALLLGDGGGENQGGKWGNASNFRFEESHNLPHDLPHLLFHKMLLTFICSYCPY